MHSRSAPSARGRLFLRCVGRVVVV